MESINEPKPQSTDEQKLDPDMSPEMGPEMDPPSRSNQEENVTFPEFLFKSFEALFELITKTHITSTQNTNDKIKEVGEKLDVLENKLLEKLDVLEKRLQESYKYGIQEIMTGLKESDEEWFTCLLNNSLLPSKSKQNNTLADVDDEFVEEKEVLVDDEVVDDDEIVEEEEQEF